MPKASNSGTAGVTVSDLWERESRSHGRRWYFRVTDPTTGRRVSKSFPDGEKPTGLRWAKQTLAHLTAHIEIAGRARLERIGAEYLAMLRDRGRGAEHVSSVERLVNAILAAGIVDLKDAHFSARFEHWLSNRRVMRVDRKEVFEVSARTKNKDLGHMKAILKYAVQRRHIPFDPLAGVKAFKEDKPIKATFGIDELRKLLSDETRTDPYWLHFVLMAYTGCRHLEALNLRWQDIRWEERHIAVSLQESYRLKRNKERLIPIQVELRDILMSVAKPHGHIIESEVERRNVDGKTFERFLKRNGIDPGNRSPHSTRHTWIALMLATDINALQVAAWAGHESLMTTSGYAQAQSMYRETVRDWPRGEFRLRRHVAQAPASTID